MSRTKSYQCKNGSRYYLNINFYFQRLIYHSRLYFKQNWQFFNTVANRRQTLLQSSYSIPREDINHLNNIALF